jgi:hypothetical protein
VRAVHAYEPLLWAAVALYGIVFLVALGSDLAGRREVPAWLWWVYGLGSVLILLQATSGAALYLLGARPRTSLHLVYGLLSAAGAVAAFGVRPRGFLRREGRRATRIVTLLSLTVTALLLRAYTTGAFGR